MSTKKIDLQAMSVDDLWSMHEKVRRILSARITSEKRELEKRLVVLNHGRDAAIEHREAIQEAAGPFYNNTSGKARRKYPRVFPKYRNSTTSAETWSGRGKQPRWLVAAIKSGRKIEDFRIRDEASPRAKRQRA